MHKRRAQAVRVGDDTRRMRTPSFRLLNGLFFGALAAGVASTCASAAATSAPTFARDVAPILYKHCVTCHRADEIGAALPLVSYESAKAHVAAIRDQVVRRAMPPWPADSSRSLKLRNDPQLSRRDIDTLAAWADAGAPRGNDADLPPVPAVAQGWLHPQGTPPDAVLSLAEISLPATGELPYVQQRVKLPLTEDKWIVAMQVRPGNDALVHHMGITELESANGVSLEQLNEFAKVAAQMGITEGALANLNPAVADPHTAGAYDMLGVYTPGTTFESYAQGGAKLLKAGKNTFINFNIHYTTSGRPEKNHVQLALWFQPQPPQHQLYRAPAAVASLLANGHELLTDDPGTKAEGTDFAIPPIPRYAENYELVGMTAYTEPVTIYQLQPHAHMRAKDFTYAVVYPDGRSVTVLTVPRYDFHWQLAYDLETPLKLPAGSKLIVTAHYDNSAKNPHLRGLLPETLAKNCGPDKEAFFRRENQSWHEMFSPLIQYSVDRDDPSRKRSGAAKAGLPIAEVVGCLAPGPDQRWTLNRASAPQVSPVQSTSAAALRASAATSLGAERYELLGAGPFAPARQGSRRVSVKGVLVRDDSGARVNVTSLQAVAGTCL